MKPYYTPPIERTASPEEASSLFHLIDPKARTAVDIALATNRPLLLTGEYGVGLSELPRSVAHELGLNPPLRYSCRPESVSKDLFYSYDTIGRLHAAQAHRETEGPNTSAFVHLNALGLAILSSMPVEARPTFELVQRQLPTYQQRSVIHVGNLELASDTFLVDLINEAENWSFTIPELGNLRMNAEMSMIPVLFLTATGGKNLHLYLPEHLRRNCIRHHVYFPSPDHTKHILESRIGESVNEETRSALLARFFQIRESKSEASIDSPGLTELITCAQAVARLCSDEPDKILTSEMFDDIVHTILGEISVDDDEEAAALKQNSVFISHSWEDKPTAEKLEAALEKNGIAVWIDHGEMRAGDSISDRIGRAIKMSRAFVLLWSGAARESHWVNRELSAAIGLNKTVVPCRVDNTELPAMLAGTMAIDFHRFDFGLNALTRALAYSEPNQPEMTGLGQQKHSSKLSRIWQIIKER